MLDGNWESVIENSVEAGDVIWGDFYESEDFVVKEGLSSRKMYVVLGKDSEDNCFGVSMINTDPRVMLGPVKITHLQYLLLANKYDFLKHDSHLNCAKIWDKPVVEVVGKIKKNYRDKCGKLAQDDFAKVMELVRNADTIKPIDKKRYGLR